MHRTTRLRLTDVNPHLICVLCGGYLIDATTIIECLHSFCRTCIIRYLETSKFCPICDVQVHKTKPYVNIRSDKTLQDLVYKLVPGLFKTEMRRRREFYQAHPEAVPNATSANEKEERGEVDDERFIYTEKEKISLCLEHYDVSRRLKESLRSSKKGKKKKSSQPDRRFLLCPAAVNITHLKKFLRLKFNLQPHYNIDIFHTDEALQDDYTLMDIACIYSWRRVEPLKLFYVVYDIKNKKKKVNKLSCPVERPLSTEPVVTETAPTIETKHAIETETSVVTIPALPVDEHVPVAGSSKETVMVLTVTPSETSDELSTERFPETSSEVVVIPADEPCENEQLTDVHVMNEKTDSPAAAVESAESAESTDPAPINTKDSVAESEASTVKLEPEQPHDEASLAESKTDNQENDTVHMETEKTENITLVTVAVSQTEAGDEEAKLLPASEDYLETSKVTTEEVKDHDDLKETANSDTPIKLTTDETGLVEEEDKITSKETLPIVEDIATDPPKIECEVKVENPDNMICEVNTPSVSMPEVVTPKPQLKTVIASKEAQPKYQAKSLKTVLMNMKETLAAKECTAAVAPGQKRKAPGPADVTHRNKRKSSPVPIRPKETLSPVGHILAQPVRAPLPTTNAIATTREQAVAMQKRNGSSCNFVALSRNVAMKSDSSSPTTNSNINTVTSSFLTSFQSPIRCLGTNAHTPTIAKKSCIQKRASVSNSTAQTKPAAKKTSPNKNMLISKEHLASPIALNYLGLPGSSASYRNGKESFVQISQVGSSKHNAGPGESTSPNNAPHSTCSSPRSPDQTPSPAMTPPGISTSHLSPSGQISPGRITHLVVPNPLSPTPTVGMTTKGKKDLSSVGAGSNRRLSPALSAQPLPMSAQSQLAQLSAISQLAAMTTSAASPGQQQHDTLRSLGRQNALMNSQKNDQQTVPQLLSMMNVPRLGQHAVMKAQLSQQPQQMPIKTHVIQNNKRANGKAEKKSKLSKEKQQSYKSSSPAAAEMRQTSPTIVPTFPNPHQAHQNGLKIQKAHQPPQMQVKYPGAILSVPTYNGGGRDYTMRYSFITPKPSHTIPQVSADDMPQDLSLKKTKKDDNFNNEGPPVTSDRIEVKVDN